MSIERASSAAAGRLSQFEAMLDSALADAAAWEFDRPTSSTVARVREIFAYMAERLDSTGAFAVAVGDDGSIELTVSGPVSYVTVAVQAGGRRVHAATVDAAEKRVVWQEEEPPLSRLAKEIERAA
ncbi:MAG: hypothetical protein U0837_07145 [Dehalococcoidia bacterium]